MVSGCVDKLLEFTCKYTKNDIHTVKVERPNGETLDLMDDDEWKGSDDRLCLSRDRTNQSVRLLIRKLQKKDFGQYKFSFERDSSDDEDEKVVLVVKQGKRLLLLLLLLL